MTLVAREITASGSGAVSIVALLGGGALARVRSVFGRDDIAIGEPRLVRLKFGGADLDEALVCALSSDAVELHLHGSPVLVRTLLAALETAGNPAPNSIAERALALLPNAASESGARILLDQAQGAWRRFVDDIANTKTANARGSSGSSSMSSAREPSVAEARVSANESLDRALTPRERVAEVVAGSRVAAFAIRAPVVVLAGAVNAGKSTLFNVLVGSERTITSPEPGTTRDLVRSRGRLGRYVVEFVDTAGERAVIDLHSEAEIERAGIERALAARARADVVLWLAAEASSRPPQGAIALHTQSDRRTPASLPAVSALFDPAYARDVVLELVRTALSLPDDPWVAGAPRAFDAATEAQLKALVACRTDEEVRTAAARFAAELRGD